MSAPLARAIGSGDRALAARDRLLVWGATLLCVGCGGGIPLMHPAQTLPIGDVRVAAGFSANVAVGGFAGALANAQSEASQNPPTGTVAPMDATYTKGALVAAAVGPELAPYASGRVGLGNRFEGGLAYTGRAVRVDLRRSFPLSEYWALSVGVGGSAVLYGHADGSQLPDVDLGQLHGWGADVPLLVGYESDDGLYMAWVGARAGGEHVDISEVRSEPKSVTLGTPPVGLSATRYWGGGLLGLAIGFRHVHVAIEVDAAYGTISGDYHGVHATVSGLTVAPGTTLWWRF